MFHRKFIWCEIDDLNILKRMHKSQMIWFFFSDREPDRQRAFDRVEFPNIKRKMRFETTLMVKTNRTIPINNSQQWTSSIDSGNHSSDINNNNNLPYVYIVQCTMYINDYEIWTVYQSTLNMCLMGFGSVIKNSAEESGKGKKIYARTKTFL